MIKIKEIELNPDTQQTFTGYEVVDSHIYQKYGKSFLVLIMRTIE